MLTVNILGTGTLGNAVRECCGPFHNVVPYIHYLDFLWVCHDTPILPNHQPDGDWLFAEMEKSIPLVCPEAHILVSSQVPPGFMARLQTRWPSRIFAYSPENIRAAHAYHDFRKQPRIFVGTDNQADKELLYCLLHPFTESLQFVTIPTAEMIKHALNGFLALSVAYGNEIGRLCSITGADRDDVARGLMSDPRIGTKAYLKPGGPYGSHLQREVYNLNQIAAGSMPLLAAIHASNELHAGYFLPGTPQKQV